MVRLLTTAVNARPIGRALADVAKFPAAMSRTFVFVDHVSLKGVYFQAAQRLAWKKDVRNTKSVIVYAIARGVVQEKTQRTHAKCARNVN